MEPGLTERDACSLWHPYAPPSSRNLAVVEAEGVHLRLSDGRFVIDAMSSWWCALFGHRHPRVCMAMQAQLATMPHVMFGGLTHAPAVELAERLLALTPGAMARVFLCDSGSVAVEVAAKMAAQFWRGLGKPEKRLFVSLRGGYHGDTFGAMALSDPERGRHSLFASQLPRHHFVPRPRTRCPGTSPTTSPAGPFAGSLGGLLGHAAAESSSAVVASIEADAAALEACLAKHGRDIAALFLEPVVQGAGGMWMYHPGVLRAYAEICRAFDVLLVADEIATGFGRTGALFACQGAEVEPDILCIGKALTAGHISLAATLCSEKVADAAARGGEGVLMHGPTYMANPLACAAANASLELLAAEPWLERAQAIEEELRAQLFPCRAHPRVADVRTLGAIGVIELKGAGNRTAIQAHAVERGVWLRPFANLVYTMPPLIASREQVRHIARTMIDALDFA